MDAEATENGTDGKGASRRVRVHVSLDAAGAADLRVLCEARGCTLSALVAEALRKLVLAELGGGK